MNRERVYVIRAPKGRAGLFLTGTETPRGEWGPRAQAMRGDLVWAQQTAAMVGGTPDAAGWRDVAESPVAGWEPPHAAAMRAREASYRGAADRAARKDGAFFGAW